MPPKLAQLTRSAISVVNFATGFGITVSGVGMKQAKSFICSHFDFRLGKKLSSYPLGPQAIWVLRCP